MDTSGALGSKEQQKLAREIRELMFNLIDESCDDFIIEGGP